MLHNAAFHLGLHCLSKLKGLQVKQAQYYFLQI